MKCKICKVEDVKAKGLCANCYMKEYYKRNPQRYKDYNIKRMENDEAKLRKAETTRNWARANRGYHARKAKEWRARRREAKLSGVADE